MTLLTIIIISHGRERLLSKCLDSLLQRDDVQVIVRKIDDDLSPGRVRNLALNEAQGQWVFFLYEDSHVGAHYWENLLPLLNDSKIDVVGGPVLPSSGIDAVSRSLSLALASSFCTGATFARYQALGKKLMVADEEKLSVANLWIRRELLNDAKFPEDYLRGEEILLLQELKARGAGTYYLPRLITYQFHEMRPMDFLWEGYYRSKLMKRKIAPGQEVYWLPAIFILLHFFVFLDLTLFWTMARLYWGIIAFVSLGLSMRSLQPWLFPLVALMHYFVVLFYGVGFILERLKFKPRKGR